ncbi:MAG: phosphatase domain-containing protein [Pseudomonadota bacterium]
MSTRDAAMLKPLALQAARLLEAGWERIADTPDGTPVLDPYIGYGRPGGVVLRARVLTNLRRPQGRDGQSMLTNIQHMVDLFLTDELPGVEVTALGQATISDEEGYVTLDVDGAFPSGWIDVDMAAAGQTAIPVPAFIPDVQAPHLIISDIDDTVIETGAHVLARNLWTTFTGTAGSRLAHADAVHLLDSLGAGTAAPVFYVSSSPWNMHHFLEQVFAHHAVPRGPIFLRDLGVTDSGIARGHLDHKGDAIDTILAANPNLPAYLLGDSGQKDAQVYLAAIGRHPNRIKGIALREPAAGEGEDDAPFIEAIGAAGVPCYHGPTFDGALKIWGLE